MRLDTESLRALKLVAETGGVTDAAERLCLTQSAVSWKLRRLEERVGHTLLRREGRTLQPTHHGRELIEFAERILSAHDAAVQRFQRSALSGSIRLGVTDDVAVNRRHRGPIPLGASRHPLAGPCRVLAQGGRVGRYR